MHYIIYIASLTIFLSLQSCNNQSSERGRIARGQPDQIIRELGEQEKESLELFKKQLEDVTGPPPANPIPEESIVYNVEYLTPQSFTGEFGTSPTRRFKCPFLYTEASITEEVQEQDPSGDSSLWKIVKITRPLDHELDPSWSSDSEIKEKCKTQFKAYSIESQETIKPSSRYSEFKKEVREGLITTIESCIAGNAIPRLPNCQIEELSINRVTYTAQYGDLEHAYDIEVKISHGDGPQENTIKRTYVFENTYFSIGGLLLSELDNPSAQPIQQDTALTPRGYKSLSTQSWKRP